MIRIAEIRGGLCQNYGIETTIQGAPTDAENRRGLALTLCGLTVLRNMLHYRNDTILQTQRSQEVLRDWKYQRGSIKSRSETPNAVGGLRYGSIDRRYGYSRLSFTPVKRQ